MDQPKKGFSVGRRWNARGALFAPPVVVPSISGEGKVAVVTGGNAGLGYEMAKGMYRLGYTVILASRDTTKGTTARAQILEEVQHSQGSIEVLVLDMSSFASVKSFATALQPHRLDALILNAGIWASTRLTVDGLGETAQVNYYSNALLAQLLLPKIRESGGRVVLLSSAMMRSGSDVFLHDSKLLGVKDDSVLYGTSKLMGALFAREWTKRVADVPFILVNPGIIATDLHRDENSADRFFQRVLVPLAWGLIGLTKEEGAQSTLFAATLADPQSLSGRYLHGTLVKQPNPLMADDKLSQWIWDTTAETLRPHLV